MAGFILWIEGVDLDETMFDTGKLSIIRGASRAYEEMPYAACAAFKGARVVALGASMVGLIIEDDESAIRAKLTPLLDKLRDNGRDLAQVEPAVRDTGSADLGVYAPFAHLRFHHALVPIAGGDVAAAIETARAKIRIGQLREPGMRLHPHVGKGVPDVPCAFDGLRTAETIIHAPPVTEVDEARGWSDLAVSRASGARWHFGRALRQRLYADARQRHEGGGRQPLAFVDDFQEMVQKDGDKRLPRLWQDGTPGDMPVSVVNKIAVFNADGDKFTHLRNELKATLGVAEGQQVFSIVLEHKMRTLLTALVSDLVRLRDWVDGAEAADVRAAVSLKRRLGEAKRHRKFRLDAGLNDTDRLLRFETLLFGGDDTLFVVPAWLGWWLAKRFFEITNGWTFDRAALEDAFLANPINALPQAKIDALVAKLEAARGGKANDPFLLCFSAGLVFADRKAPIRALKNLANDLMYQAKSSGGGLEVEVLESLEPPEGGLDALRDPLFGKGWKADRKTDKERSLLTIPRNMVSQHVASLVNLWCGKEPLPASPLHRALRDARRRAEGLSSPEAQNALKTSLEQSEKRSPGVEKFCAGEAQSLWCSLRGPDLQTLRLHGLLQQRDSIRANQPWLELIEKLPAEASQ